MLRQIKHDRIDATAFPVRVGGRFVAAILNDITRKKAVERRFSQLIELLTKARELSGKYPNKSAFDGPARAVKLERQIAMALKRCRAGRCVFLAKGQLVAQWMPLGNIEFGEFLALNTLAKLAEENTLHRLRRCMCGKYFFGRSSSARFCSSACRVKFWENSEERKEQKRRKAREYYELHKRGIVKRSNLQKKGK